MPKVKAYFGDNGQVVPVSQAIEGTAYLSPFDGKVFGHKDKYVEHLRTVRDRIHTNIHKKNKVARMRKLWKSAASFQDIIDWVANNQEFFYKEFLAAAWHVKNPEKYPYDPDQFGIIISSLKLEYKDWCSNSHAAPHNGKTNWSGRDTLKDGSPAPRGYPGWYGRIEFQLKKPKKEIVRFESDTFKALRIHTGSGGSGNGIKYGYDVTFFDADWPALAEATALEHNMAKTMNLLADRLTPKLKYDYGTEDYFKW